MIKIKKNKDKAQPAGEAGDSKVTFYPAWCKRCGNCVAFCPRKALGMDEWGHPYLEKPERCTECGLCEMLCPDFAISVGEGEPAVGRAAAGGQPQPAAAHEAPPTPTGSPERLAPSPETEVKNAD